MKDGEFLFFIGGGLSFVVCGSWWLFSNFSNLFFCVYYVIFFYLGFDRFGLRDFEIYCWVGFFEILIFGRINFILF